MHFFLPTTDVLLKRGEQRLIKITLPFIDEITGLAMIKLLDLKTGCTNTINVKFIRNTGYPDIPNSLSVALVFIKDEAIGVVDLRSTGYCKVKQYYTAPFTALL